MVECVENYEERSGNTVNIGVGDPEPNNFVATVRAWQGVDTFVAIATAAGENLDNETFMAAAADLGSFDLTGATARSAPTTPRSSSSSGTPTPSPWFRPDAHPGPEWRGRRGRSTMSP